MDNRWTSSSSSSSSLMLVQRNASGSVRTAGIDHDFSQMIPASTAIGAIGDTILVIILVGLIVISIVGNLLVCVAVFTERKLRKLGNAFIVSLAIADLFVSCLVMTFALCNELLEYWPFGDRFCDLFISLDIMCCTASILNLCAISLDRFIMIKDCLLYNRLMTRKIALASLILIWFISALVSFVPITLGWHKPDHQFTSYSSGKSNPNPSLKSISMESVSSSDLPSTIKLKSQSQLPSTLSLAFSSNVPSAISRKLIVRGLSGKAFPPSEPYDAITSQGDGDEYQDQEPPSGELPPLDLDRKQPADRSSGGVRITREPALPVDDGFLNEKMAPKSGNNQSKTQQWPQPESESSECLDSSVACSLRVMANDERAGRNIHGGDHNSPGHNLLFPGIKTIQLPNLGEKMLRNSVPNSTSGHLLSSDGKRVKRDNAQKHDHGEHKSDFNNGNKNNISGPHSPAVVNKLTGSKAIHPSASDRLKPAAGARFDQNRKSGQLLLPLPVTPFTDTTDIALVNQHHVPTTSVHTTIKQQRRFRRQSLETEPGSVANKATGNIIDDSDSKAAKKGNAYQQKADSAQSMSSRQATPSASNDPNDFTRTNSIIQAASDTINEEPTNSVPGDQPQCILTLTPTYAIVSSTISFYIPCIIMIGLYTKLYACAMKHVKNIQSISKAPAPILGTITCPSNESSVHSVSSQQNKSSNNSAISNNFRIDAKSKVSKAVATSSPATTTTTTFTTPTEAPSSERLNEKFRLKLNGHALDTARGRASASISADNSFALAKIDLYVDDDDEPEVGDNIDNNCDESEQTIMRQKNVKRESRNCRSEAGKLPDLSQQDETEPFLQPTSDKNSTDNNEKQHNEIVPCRALNKSVSLDLGGGKRGSRHSSSGNKNSENNHPDKTRTIRFHAMNNKTSNSNNTADGKTVSPNGSNKSANDVDVTGHQHPPADLQSSSSILETSPHQLATNKQQTKKQTIANKMMMLMVANSANTNSGSSPLAALSPTAPFASSNQLASGGSGGGGTHTSGHLATHKAAITLGIIMGTFLFCWVPFFCINIIKAFCSDCITSSMFRFFTWLGYANSALNPIIYGIHNSEFRCAFNRIFFKHLRLKNTALTRRFSFDVRHQNSISSNNPNQNRHRSQHPKATSGS